MIEKTDLKGKDEIQKVDSTKLHPKSLSIYRDNHSASVSPDSNLQPLPGSVINKLMPTVTQMNKDLSLWLPAHVKITFLLCLVLCFPRAITTLAHGNETDRLALLAFKSKITDDPFAALSSWNDSIHFCQWNGVKCSPQHQRVIALDLGHQRLSGTISTNAGNLSFLRTMYLHNNSLSGEIPPELGRLKRLEYLWLDNNRIVGEIPVNISGCSNLVDFSASRNKLGGKIPVELGSLSKLRYIRIRYNELIGTIPPSLGNLSSLVVLYAATNRLVGGIPNVLGQLRKLEFINFHVNRLSGTFSPAIFNLTSLTSLSVGDNQFQGTLPSNLGITLPHMEYFRIGGNQFSGSIPVSMSNMSKLVELILSNNELTGKVPNFGNCHKLDWFNIADNHLGNGDANELSFIAPLANATNLTILSINANNFGGILPESIGNLSTKLTVLELYLNQISGDILSQIGNLANLERFFIWGNQFTGHIPSTIGKLHRLRRLMLSWNKLSGNIPSSIGNLTSLTELQLQENTLQGSIPPSLANCQKLVELDLSRNSLNGTIPPQVLGISSLSLSLNLSDNKLIGSVPTEVGNLKNLRALDISRNALSGEFPSTLAECQSLVILSLNGNFFRGTIPSSFSSLRGIQLLDLSQNNLSGRIPEFFGILDLEYLNISFNEFEGPIPKEGIFKNASAVSVNGNSKLCGGIPELMLPRCNFEGSKSIISSFAFKITISLASLLLGVVVLGFLLYFCWFKRTKKETSSDLDGNSLLKVSYQILLQATNGFSTANLIGVGSFGSVYKAFLDDGTCIAVKVLNLLHHGASKSFIAECAALKNIKHRNLVKVLTVCSGVDYQGNDFKALVYEYMDNGSLEEYLHPNQKVGLTHLDSKKLNLVQRLNIAIDVAFALDYLHNGGLTSIVHCDIKPSNILLDKQLVGHVGDFGLARLLPIATPDTSTNSSSSTSVTGSVGYTAPEYGLGSAISRSGDVYSFGILLLEMFTGKRPTDDMFEDGLNLHNFVALALPDRVADIVDPILLEEEETKMTKIHEECLISLFRVGLACSKQYPCDRMNISYAAAELYSINNALATT